MPNVIDKTAGILYEGDELEIPPVMVYCQKRCKELGRRTIVFAGQLAPGTGIRIKCSRCRKEQSFALGLK
jgi:hypothetical protein